MEGDTQFEMDLNTGLTQALSDGTNTYLYGNGRIGQFTGVDSAYFLGDELGSVRQLVNTSGQITLVRSYNSYGEVMGNMGNGQTAYSFTGEWNDVIGLTYLRARHMAPWLGRFITKDLWQGNNTTPISFNKWVYGNSNPLSI